MKPLADIVTAEKRSQMMSGIHGKDTRPELLIRRGLYQKGFRFRLCVSKLPGKPDIVLAKYKTIILVHGCFWHGHYCRLFKWPSSHPEFWKAKIHGNQQNDAEILAKLDELGWRVLVVWECATKGPGKWPANRLLDVISDWVVKGSQNLEIGGL
jgi:DNA mismatch endonuclease, patch repair protein